MRILQVSTLLRAASALVIVSVLAAAIGQIKLLLPGLLCLAALLFAAACIDSIRAGDRPSLERDWGGLGLEPGGWRLSPSLAYLLAAAVFGALSVAGLGVAVIPGHPPAASPNRTADAPQQDQRPKRSGTPVSPEGPTSDPRLETRPHADPKAR